MIRLKINSSIIIIDIFEPMNRNLTEPGMDPETTAMHAVALPFELFFRVTRVMQIAIITSFYRQHTKRLYSLFSNLLL